MAVTLTLDYVERNDNKLLTLTDVSTDWGSPAVGNISTLTLDVSITTSDSITTDYTQINLVTFAALDAGSTQANLVFALDAADLIDNGTALGTSVDVLPDGLYTFTYTLDYGLATESILEESVLIEGVVRSGVYDLLRTIPTLYMCTECKSKQILDAIFAYGYLNSMRAGGYVAKTEELLTQLSVLERLLNYGSSFTW